MLRWSSNGWWMNALYLARSFTTACQLGRLARSWLTTSTHRSGVPPGGLCIPRGLPSRASATNTGSRRDVARKATNGDEGNSNPPRAGKKPRREQGPDDRPILQQRRQRRAVPSRILSTRQAD